MQAVVGLQREQPVVAVGGEPAQLTAPVDQSAADTGPLAAVVDVLDVHVGDPVADRRAAVGRRGRAGEARLVPGIPDDAEAVGGHRREDIRRLVARRDRTLPLDLERDAHAGLGGEVDAASEDVGSPAGIEGHRVARPRTAEDPHRPRSQLGRELQAAAECGPLGFADLLADGGGLQERRVDDGAAEAAAPDRRADAADRGGVVLDELHSLGRPLYVSLSRKDLIGAVLAGSRETVERARETARAEGELAVGV